MFSLWDTTPSVVWMLLKCMKHPMVEQKNAFMLKGRWPFLFRWDTTPPVIQMLKSMKSHMVEQNNAFIFYGRWPFSFGVIPHLLLLECSLNLSKAVWCNSNTLSCSGVGAHSLPVKYRTLCCSNTFEIYEKTLWWSRTTLSCSRVGGHSLSVRYHTLCCSNALPVNAKLDGGAETNAFIF